MTAREELERIFKESSTLQFISYRTDKALKGIYKALFVLADRIDKDD